MAAGAWGMLTSPARAALDVCVKERAESPGTFLNVVQHPCETVDVVPRAPLLPADVPALPEIAAPVPPVAGMPARPDTTGEVCVELATGAPLSLTQAPCFGVPVPALPLPPTLGYDDVLPEYPLLPVGLPPLPAPVPVGGLPVPLPPLPG
jgi:hypothetical protein